MAKKSQKRIGKLVFKNEKSFRRVLVQSIEDGGGFAQAIEATTGSGIPDLYYTNDRALAPTWAELKVVRRGDKVGLRKRQYDWLKKNNDAKGASELIVNDHTTGTVLSVFVAEQSFEELNSLRRLRESLKPLEGLVEVEYRTRAELDNALRSK